ncbi:MAG: hypothetical protein ACW99Q_26710 [Candidatus Kariarchaeaceae archaeon]|jgi:hypothetical protein
MARKKQQPKRLRVQKWDDITVDDSLVEIRRFLPGKMFEFINSILNGEISIPEWKGLIKWEKKFLKEPNVKKTLKKLQSKGADTNKIQEILTKFKCIVESDDSQNCLRILKLSSKEWRHCRRIFKEAAKQLAGIEPLLKGWLDYPNPALLENIADKLKTEGFTKKRVGERIPKAKNLIENLCVLYLWKHLKSSTVTGRSYWQDITILVIAAFPKLGSNIGYEEIMKRAKALDKNLNKIGYDFSI